MCLSVEVVSTFIPFISGEGLMSLKKIDVATSSVKDIIEGLGTANLSPQVRLHLEAWARLSLADRALTVSLTQHLLQGQYLDAQSVLGGLDCDDVELQ